MKNVKLSLRDIKVLVTEDDVQLRGTIRDILVSLGAEVRTAENGLVAKTILALSDKSFDLVLSDIKMPEMDGIQLLTYFKKHALPGKFLIFTGFSEFLETHTAAELGADAFLAKPFRLAELVRTIEHILNPQVESLPDVQSEMTEQAFCKVPIDEFFSTTRLTSDIYIKVGKIKFVKIAREGAEIELNRLQHFKEHKVEHLFVCTGDFHKYTGLNLKIANAIVNSDKISVEKKMRLFKHTSEMLLQQIFMVGIDKSICDDAYDMMDNTMKSIGSNDDLFEVLLGLQSRSDSLYSHSLGVAVYACMIASKIGWNSTANQHKIAIAGLFHDVGFKELPEGLHDKPRFKMTAEEIKWHESHASRGKEILISVPGYPADLLTIIAQHHENCEGQGYPLGLSSIKIHPLAKLLRFADEFTEKMNSAPTMNSKVASEILKEIFESKRDEFDAEILAGAFDLFQISRPAGLKYKAA